MQGELDSGYLKVVNIRSIRYRENRGGAGPAALFKRWQGHMTRAARSDKG